MVRGYSLEQDLRLLMNNPKYSDVEILCENEKILHGGCRAILAARSEVFEKLLYERQVSFQNLNTTIWNGNNIRIYLYWNNSKRIIKAR